LFFLYISYIPDNRPSLRRPDHALNFFCPIIVRAVSTDLIIRWSYKHRRRDKLLNPATKPVVVCR